MTQHIFLDGLDNGAKARLLERVSASRLDAIVKRALPGTPVAGAESLAEVLAKGGADFEVGKRPIMAVLDGDTAVEIPGQAATIRLDTGAPLGVVGEGYGVVQNHEALAPADALIRSGELLSAAVRVVDGGKRVQLTGLIGASALAKPLPSGGPDILAHFVRFTTSHDWSSGVSEELGMLRLVCLNGLTAKSIHSRISVSHTANALDRLEKARAALGSFAAVAREEVADFDRLASERMTLPEYRAFAQELLNQVRGEADTDRKRSKRERDIAELESLFCGGKGNAGETLWDGWQSVAEWIDGKRERAGKAFSPKAWDSANAGHGARIKARARRLLTRS